MIKYHLVGKVIARPGLLLNLDAEVKALGLKAEVTYKQGNTDINLANIATDFDSSEKTKDYAIDEKFNLGNKTFYLDELMDVASWSVPVDIKLTGNSYTFDLV